MNPAWLIAGALVVLASCGVVYMHNAVNAMSLEVSVMANEVACKAKSPNGYASYPVSHFGELRGCVYVTDGARPIIRLVRPDASTQ